MAGILILALQFYVSKTRAGEYEWTPGAANNRMVTQQGLIVSTIQYGVIGGRTALYGVHEDIHGAMESIHDAMESINTQIQAVRTENE